MRDLRVSLLSLATCSALFLGATDATGQALDARSFQPRNDAGIFSIKRTFNATDLSFLQGITCDGQAVDCALTSAIWHKGRFWVLSRVAWTEARPEQFIHEWDNTGTYLGPHLIPIPSDPQNDLHNHTTADTAPEVRDMATDEGAGGEAIMIGSEEGLYITRYNVAQNKWELHDTIMAANGPKTIAAGDFENPIRGEALAKLRFRSEFDGDLTHVNSEGEGYMGVAYDPEGNSGNGSFWVSADDGGGVGGWLLDENGNDIHTSDTSLNEFDSSVKNIYEIDMKGNILTTLVNGGLVDDPTHWRFGHSRGGYWVAGGLELDPITGNLWVNMEPDNQNTIEVDIATGEPTGIEFPGFVATPGRVGGLVGIPRGDPGSYASFWDLIAFTNVAGDDYFTVHRMHQYPGLHGLQEPLLQASTGGIPLGSPSPIPYTNQDTFNILINTEGRGGFKGTNRPDFPALLMFDFGDDTLSDAETDPGLGLGVIPELRVHSALSNPPATGGSILFSTSTGQELNLDLTNFQVNTGDRFRVQALYFEPFSQYSPGLMVSNEIWASGVGINEVLVEADGENSFGVYVDGFFKVTWLAGPAITNVKFDLEATQSNDDLLNACFEANESNMNDHFGAGSGFDAMGNRVTLGGCDGTYRNDSDVTTGLVFDANNTAMVSARGQEGTNPTCTYWTDQGMTMLSGFVGSKPEGTDDWQAIEFNFTDFGLDNGAPHAAGVTETFGFDCDTDDVVTRGGGHLGTVITVTRADGSVLEAELLPDPEDPNRSFIAW